MAVSFWEFRSETVGEIHELAREARAGGIGEGYAVERIEQICTECDLAYDQDGCRLEDDEVRELVRAHYNDPSLALTWEA